MVNHWDIFLSMSDFDLLIFVICNMTSMVFEKVEKNVT